MQPDKYYHIYNHANGEENLFRNEENYRYFLERYNNLVSPVCKTYAYCLMPNHFHFLVQVRNENALIGFLNKEKEVLAKEEMQHANESALPDMPSLVINQFSKFFNSYTKSFNKMFDRRGSLFNRAFKRKPIDNQKYFTRVIQYIHNNPIHHGFADKPENWPFSSYHSFLTDKPTQLERENVLEWFGGRNEFANFHHTVIDWELMNELQLE